VLNVLVSDYQKNYKNGIDPNLFLIFIESFLLGDKMMLKDNKRLKLL